MIFLIIRMSPIIRNIRQYVNNCKALTPYDIPVTAKYGDKLITLSTCSYHTDEGRYVVVAKRVK